MKKDQREDQPRAQLSRETILVEFESPQRTIDPAENHVNMIRSIKYFDTEANDNWSA